MIAGRMMRILLAAVVGLACCAQAGIAQEPEQKATDKVIVRAWLIEFPEEAMNRLSEANRGPENLALCLKYCTQPSKRNPYLDAQEIVPVIDKDYIQVTPVDGMHWKLSFQSRTFFPKPPVLADSAVETTGGKWGTFDKTTAILYFEKQRAAQPPEPEKPAEATYVLRTLKERVGTVLKARPEIRPDGQVGFEFEFSWTRVDSRSPVEGAESLPVGLPALRTTAVKSNLVAKPGVPVLGGELSRVTTETDDKGNKTEFKERVYLLLEVEIPKADE